MTTEPFSSVSITPRSSRSFITRLTISREAPTTLAMAEDDNGVKIIRHKVSRQDMAKVVGASREMVSRVMKDLEDRGVIETLENGSVVIKERLQND